MHDIATALTATASRLAAAGIDDSRREARLLMATALGWDAARVLAYPESVLDAEAEARLESLLARRARREPMARILGHREFWSLRFELSPATLDPRPDSETLIEAALAALPDRAQPYRALDLGTGSGCLLLALLSELPQAWGLGIDRAAEAVATARRNAAALGLGSRARFAVGDWATAIAGDWHAILVNPPYIASGAIAGLMPEVAKHEPRLALDGGRDGLDAYRTLLPQVAGLLAPQGVAVIELGEGQLAAVAEIASAVGLVIHGKRHDLAGVERCLIVARAALKGLSLEKVVGMFPAPV
ncbi:MAG TPA: peptide chain release factor N(5)-glutamine methyltransferase [Stellaceae bacterium]|nr:peptide chain release factor N(5)-glutamine methyltransferase [Stellaceae bacterium]